MGANEGVNRLARTLQGRMHELDESPPILDFASVQSDFSLLTNHFPRPIPQSDYLICNTLRSAQPGDRVLVAWAGNEPCVIDRVVSADTASLELQS